MIPQVSVAELKSSWDAGQARIIDVRESWEYDQGHVPGAIWIPMSEVPARLEEFRGQPPAQVICRTGNRSGQVVMWLGQQGIETVNVEGGTEDWGGHGFPLAQGMETGHAPSPATPPTSG